MTITKTLSLSFLIETKVVVVDVSWGNVCGSQPLTFHFPFLSTCENMNYCDDNIDYSVPEKEIPLHSFFYEEDINTKGRASGNFIAKGNENLFFRFV